MRPAFDGFDWDQGNSEKSSVKHGIGRETIEDFLLGGPAFVEDPKHSSHEKRYLALGQNEEGRWMVVAFTLRAKGGKRFLRPISARYMHAKEVSRYEDLH